MSQSDGKCHRCTQHSSYDLLLTCPTCQGSGMLTVPERVIVGKFFVPRVPTSTFYFNRPTPFYPPAFYPLYHQAKPCCTEQLRPEPHSCARPETPKDETLAEVTTSNEQDPSPVAELLPSTHDVAQNLHPTEKNIPTETAEQEKVPKEELLKEKQPESQTNKKQSEENVTEDLKPGSNDSKEQDVTSSFSKENEQDALRSSFNDESKENQDPRLVSNEQEENCLSSSEDITEQRRINDAQDEERRIEICPSDGNKETISINEDCPEEIRKVGSGDDLQEEAEEESSLQEEDCQELVCLDESGDSAVAGCSFFERRGSRVGEGEETTSLQENGIIPDDNDWNPEDYVLKTPKDDEVEDGSEQNTIRFVPSENEVPELQWGDFFNENTKEEEDEELESVTTEYECSSMNSFQLHDIIEDPIGEAAEESERYELRRVVKVLEAGTQCPDKSARQEKASNKETLQKSTEKTTPQRRAAKNTPQRQEIIKQTTEQEDWTGETIFEEEEPIPEELKLPELRQETPSKFSKKSKTLSPREALISPMNLLTRERIRRAMLERKKTELDFVKVRQETKKDDDAGKNVAKGKTGSATKRWNY